MSSDVRRESTFHANTGMRSVTPFISSIMHITLQMYRCLNAVLAFLGLPLLAGDVLPLPEHINEDLYRYELSNDWEKEALEKLMQAPVSEPPPAPAQKAKSKAAQVEVEVALEGAAG